MTDQGSRKRAREVALQALYEWQLTQEAPAEIEQHFLASRDLKGADQAYFQILVREVPARRDGLDARLASHMDRPIAEVDPVERAILRMGVYELECHPEIPYRVILNEAIELAKTFGADQGHRYVNAVLDKVAAELRRLEVSPS